MHDRILIILLSIIFCVIGGSNIHAQSKITLHGSIIDAESKKPILYANVAIKELGVGMSSNEDGEFTIKSVMPGEYTLQVTYIGYKEYVLKMNLNKDVDLKIQLKQQSLGLQEVTVTAENASKGTTSSKINSDAISHVQASSVIDVMQLIPGNLSTNPDLGKPATISIREIGTDKNSALGTAIIVDDIPLSNDGNMQGSIRTGNSFSSVVNTGIDLREIPVENIESITVDLGIPSVEHGNLTSGAVHIKTKSGGSPMTTKFKADPHTKQFYIGKGLLLENDKGVVNLDLGYTQSYKYLVKQTDLYKRINGTVKYSNTYFRETAPLHLELKLDMVTSLDDQKWDPDMLAEEENYSNDKKIGVKGSFVWSLNKAYISSLSLDVGFGKTWQEGYEKTLETSSSGATFFATSRESGEYEIEYGPSSYYSEVDYDGKPFNIYGKLKAKLFKKTGIMTNNILFGAEWRTTGNNGNGILFNPTRPPHGLGYRPRPFSDIPSLNQLAFFAEDKVSLKIGTTDLELMAGLRLDNVQPTGLWKTDGNISVDPRLNLSYQFLNSKNNSIFKNLALRLGYGKTSKSPTLAHLYPDNEYNDVESFNYYPDLIVVTTDVKSDLRNTDLKPASSTKLEFGVDFKVNKTSGRITFFSEKHEGGFINNRILYPMYYRDYDVIDAGLSPYYIEGSGVYYNDLETGVPTAVGYEDDYAFKGYSVYQNASVREKRGIEYSIDFGKIKALRTSLNVTGAYFQTESYTKGMDYWETEMYTVFEGNTSRQESFAVMYPDRNGYGTIDERLNTNFNIITHIPELKMVVTLTSQVVWFEKDHRTFYKDKKLYGLSELREYLNIPDLFSYEDEEDFYYYLPVKYKNYDNVEHDYVISDFQNSLNQQAIKKTAKYWFEERVWPVLFLCNLKLSKDIGDRIRLSFYANNFFNIRPYHLNTISGVYRRRNSEPYFGADLRIQF